jgi:hypothetical protein
MSAILIEKKTLYTTFETTRLTIKTLYFIGLLNITHFKMCLLKFCFLHQKLLMALKLHSKLKT